ncbi:hypothetical protein BN940_17631 [Castellaniella defragrans 65Phen]|uniref:Uncharacterized protein n=1 Tax=Castellaniella defragrans (strain DSM 12143 / CCUG 39792 / 65Phen) TaxID=1437824 RepID=W8X5V5_CASD6|nr:hypothetical protein BN940_17631 [Castellaniella defragrans 65Phen]
MTAALRLGGLGHHGRDRCGGLGCACPGREEGSANMRSPPPGLASNVLYRSCDGTLC